MLLLLVASPCICFPCAFSSLARSVFFVSEAFSSSGMHSCSLVLPGIPHGYDFPLVPPSASKPHSNHGILCSFKKFLTWEGSRASLGKHNCALVGELPGCIMAHIVLSSGKWDGAMKKWIFQALCLLLVWAGEQVQEKKELSILPAPLKQTFNN